MALFPHSWSSENSRNKIEYGLRNLFNKHNLFLAPGQGFWIMSEAFSLDVPEDNK